MRSPRTSLHQKGVKRSYPVGNRPFPLKSRPLPASDAPYQPTLVSAFRLTRRSPASRHR